MLGKITGKKVDCLVCPRCLAMILPKDDEQKLFLLFLCYYADYFNFSVNKCQTNKEFYTTF